MHGRVADNSMYRIDADIPWRHTFEGLMRTFGEEWSVRLSKDGYDVVIIGSGIGGLTSAALLSKEGFRVMVFEGNKRIGGCCSAYEKNGYSFDVGAVFVLYIEIYERLFELLGKSMDSYLDMRLIDPVYDIYFDHGENAMIHYDVEKTVEGLMCLNHVEAENYRSFCRDMSKIWSGTKVAGETPFPSLEEATSLHHQFRRLLNPALLRNLPLTLRVARGSQQKTINRYFGDRRFKAIVGFENLYAGLPAHRINGLFTLLSYVCHEGYYYPRGGMVAIPRALADIARANGSEIVTHSPVRSIIVKNGRALGVALQDGEEVPARMVISNASCIPTYLQLVGAEKLPGPLVKAIMGYRPSIPCPIVYFGLKEKPPFRCHSAVLIGDLDKVNAYWDEFYAKGLMARVDDIPVGLACPSLYDDTLAPKGKYAVSAILPSPYRLKYHSWDEVKPYFIEEVIRSVERRAFPNFGSMIEFADMTTPLDFERELNLPEGAIYGLEMSLTQLGPFRASWKSPVIENLYLTGASTNPGGGVPLVMTSGIMVSSLVKKNWKA